VHDPSSTDLIPANAAAARRRAAAALALLIPAPSLGVCASMVLWPGPFGLTLWTISKVWILVLPLAWVRFVERGELRLPGPPRAGLGVGVASGLLFAIVTLAAGILWLEPRLDPAPLREMARANAIASPAGYLRMALYIALINALLEEYVWRWFVYRRFESLLAPRAAVLASAAAFTLHHTVILSVHFSWEMALLGSAAVFAAGALWSWCYLRFRSIWPGYASHVIVDVAVLWLGWRLIRG
jgi:membrane protease YdiL (CAAX protease family)